MPSCDSLPNPLAPPQDRQLLDQFHAQCGLGTERDPSAQLAVLARAFAAVPYENLTKIIKYAEFRVPAAARRAPSEVLRDFQCAGAGGTCFSLTAALLHVFNHSVFKSLLFFGAGAVLNSTGERDMEHLGGLIHRMPQTAFVFLVGCVAISALPPHAPCAPRPGALPSWPRPAGRTPF